MKYVTRPLTLSKRLILTFTAVIILTLMLAGAFCYQQTRQVIQSNQLETMTHLMSKMAGSLGTTLANAIGITEQVLYADDVYDSMFQENVTISSNQVGTFKHIQQYLYMLAEQFDFKKIRIFTNNTSLIYQTEGSYFCALDRLSSMIPIDDTVRVRTKQVQIADTYHASAIWNDYRISVVRLLLEGPKLCGAVVVDLESSSLLKGWGEEDMPVMLINREGRVLASTDESQMNAVLPKETVDDVYANVFVQDGSLCRLSSKIENSDWRLVMTLSSQALTTQRRYRISISHTLISALIPPRHPSFWTITVRMSRCATLWRTARRCFTTRVERSAARAAAPRLWSCLIFRCS